MPRPLRTTLLAAITVAVCLAQAGCYHGSLYADRPKNKLVDLAISQMWADEIRRIARDGDWILSRSLTWEGDTIAFLTGYEQFSHASIVDVTHGTIIEATTPEVREISIEELMQRNRHVVVVRPNGISAERSRLALDYARAQLGLAFDLWGFVGYEEPDKWYCTELIFWASGMEELHGKEVVLMPKEMMKYGEVIYYSGRRDDVQVQALAAARLNVGHDTAVADAPSSDPDEALQRTP
jgi:hypothetical protein